MKECQGKNALENDFQGKQEDYDRSSPEASSFYRYIPNTLTIVRVLGTPVSVWLIAQNQLTIAFWVFLGISTTDWLDGYLARRWQVTSKLGQILDPIADKFLIISVYLALGLWNFIPLWLSALVLARDLLILISSSVIILTQKIKIKLAPSLMGKISTAAQMLFVGLILTREFPHPSIPTSSIENNLMIFLAYSVAFLTILSGITYARAGINAFRKL